MKKEVTIELDEHYAQIFETEAQKNGLTLSQFLEKSSLLLLLNSKSSILELEKGSVKKAGRKPNVRIPEKLAEQIYQQFIAYLNDFLLSSKLRYRWHFELNEESYTDWLPAELYSGTTKKDSDRLLALGGKMLHQALDTGNEQLCFEAIRLVMDWGGVYYNFKQGVQRGNESAVTELLSSRTLLSTIRQNDEYIRNNLLEKLDFYTSGWGIVWYCLEPDAMIIMGSREIYALNQIIQNFQTDYQYHELPASISLGQLVYQNNRRYIDGVSYVYTKGGKLKMLKKYLRIINSVYALGSFKSKMAIDDALFMLGE